LLDGADDDEKNTTKVERLDFLEPGLSGEIRRLERAPGAERHIRVFNAGAALHRALIGDEFRPAVPVRGWRRLYRAGRLLFHCIAGSVRAMNDPSSPILVLSGAGGGVVDPAFFCSSTRETRRFETIVYPGWRRYAEIGFSVESLVEDLAAQMAARAPEGPIRVIGMSLSAHLAYAAGLELQASGREIGGFCALDPYARSTVSPTAGWRARALKTAAALLWDQRLTSLAGFCDAGSGARHCDRRAVGWPKSSAELLPLGACRGFLRLTRSSSRS